MRAYESVALAYFLIISALACVVPIDGRRRIRVIAGCGALAGLIWWLRSPATPAIENLRLVAPLVYMLAGYWLPAQFYRTSNTRLEQLLCDVDRRLHKRFRIDRWLAAMPRALVEWLELAYFLTFVLAALGLATLLAAERRDTVEVYWTAVLLAQLVPFGTLATIQTRPPWLLEPADPAGARPVFFRRLNLLVLRHGSNQLNTIPSGHASGSLAAALAIHSVLPVVGGIFHVLAWSIGLAAYLGRYHYAADVVLGWLLGWACWHIARAIV